MFELDKEKFGAFIAQLRKEKGLTQKEVAEQLFISDKAVSKWERALSLPDITLLVPLAEVLGVTATELLEGQRIGQEQTMARQQVETLVQRAITLSEEEEKDAPLSVAYLPQLAIALAVAALELLLLLSLERLNGEVLLLELMWAIFGGYFCLFAPKRLPVYYDENRIGVFIHGPLHINLPGVVFHNSNWPHIAGYCRAWMLAALVLYPPLTLADAWFLDSIWYGATFYLFLKLAIILGSLFVPLYVLAKKYE